MHNHLVKICKPLTQNFFVNGPSSPYHTFRDVITEARKYAHPFSDVSGACHNTWTDVFAFRFECDTPALRQFGAIRASPFRP